LFEEIQVGGGDGREEREQIWENHLSMIALREEMIIRKGD